MKYLSLMLIFMMLFPLAFYSAKAKKDQAETQIEKIKPVLVVMDIQNHYLPMMDKTGQEKSLNYINRFMDFFRKNGQPVICVYHTTPGQGPEPGTEAFAYPESIIIKDTDIKITKNFPNAFKQTDLVNIIKEKQINTVFLCGLSSTGCVLATYFGGIDLDLNTVMLEGALIGPNAAHTKAVEELTGAMNPHSLMLLMTAIKAQK
jgi:nicotinamidase-related amidase